MENARNCATLAMILTFLRTRQCLEELVCLYLSRVSMGKDSNIGQKCDKLLVRLRDMNFLHLMTNDNDLTVVFLQPL